eukprot:TRINITY_DN10458_c0_g1_i1.p1 TRINITY_DN10458_c0_g1~~TRINITY_DN10458_c0_g1_i1.p1  ORF type:complete len:457 (-),score=93.93 TRINITY_DN10458_c0_g1_i1:73-1443(-)
MESPSLRSVASSDSEITSAHISLQDIISKHESASNDVCSECEVLNATVNCTQCQDIFCPECSKKVHSKGARRQHVIVPYQRKAATTPAAAARTPLRLNMDGLRRASSPSITSSSPARKLCPVHSVDGERQNLYCLQDRMFVCAKCVDMSHHNHTVTSPRRALFDTFDQIQRDCGELVQRSQAIETALTKLDALQHDVSEEAERVNREITANVAHLHSILDDRERILRDTVSATRTRKLEVINERMRELSDLNQNMIDAVAKADASMKVTKPLSAAAAIDGETFPSMLAQHMDIAARVAGLKDVSAGLSVPTSAAFNLRLEAAKQIHALQNLTFDETTARQKPNSPRETMDEVTTASPHVPMQKVSSMKRLGSRVGLPTVGSQSTLNIASPAVAPSPSRRPGVPETAYTYLVRKESMSGSDLQRRQSTASASFTPTKSLLKKQMSVSDWRESLRGDQ